VTIQSVINRFSFISRADITRENNMDLIVTAFSLSVYIWLTDWLTSVNYLCHIHLQRCVLCAGVQVLLQCDGRTSSVARRQQTGRGRVHSAVSAASLGCQVADQSRERVAVEGHPRRLP